MLPATVLYAHKFVNGLSPVNSPAKPANVTAAERCLALIPSVLPVSVQDAFAKMGSNLRKGWRTTLHTESRQKPGKAVMRRWFRLYRGAPCLPCDSCGTREPCQSCHIFICTAKKADSSMICPGWGTEVKQLPCGCGASFHHEELEVTQLWNSTTSCNP